MWLASLDPELINTYTSNPLYKFLDHKLSDNDSMIEFIKTLPAHYQETHEKMTALQKQQLKQITGNILKSLSWEDDYVFDKVRPIITDILHIENTKDIFPVEEIQRPLKDSVTLKDLDETYKDYKNLKYLSIKNDTQEEIALSHENFSWLKALKALTIKSKSLKKMVIPYDIFNLNVLDISGSSIEEIIGLHHLTNLKKLDLSGTNGINKIEFTYVMPALKDLNLSRSSIAEIVGLHHLTNLEALRIRDTKNLKKIEFTKVMTQLKDLDLAKSSIAEIMGLHHLVDLETLSLRQTRNFKKIEFKEDMPTLKDLNFYNSSLTEIVGLEHLINLEKLYLHDIKDFKNIEFTKVMSALKDLDLSGSSVTEIRGFHHLINLNKLGFSNTSIFELTIPEEIISLKYIDLNSAKKLQSLTFTKDHKDLELNLRNSGITHKNQINGIEFLDESKIKW